MKAKLLKHINAGRLDRIGDSGHDLPDEEVTVLCGPLAAMKAYPKEKGGSYRQFGCIKYDKHSEERNAFIKGYEQAEKDLALTWEDVQLLDFYAMECQVEESKGRKFNSSQEFFEEVLRRFNAIKEDMK